MRLNHLSKAVQKVGLCQVLGSVLNPIAADSLNLFVKPFGASQVVLVLKNPLAYTRDIKRHGFDPWVGKMPLRMKGKTTPVLLPRESHGLRSLVG